ncbi:MAG: hypothetical protein JXR73_05840 [Candidatus Omnitrophica bacterium]|nr:hypothetical protein [Candidatus Omnitrophota bacterium]
MKKSALFSFPKFDRKFLKSSLPEPHYNLEASLILSTAIIVYSDDSSFFKPAQCQDHKEGESNYRNTASDFNILDESHIRIFQFILARLPGAAPLHE